ncbi:MAG: hypothetical protein AB3N14_08585 [Flavobacteriaceae bacterium]
MKNFTIFAALILLSSCSSVETVSNWKNEEYPIFEANKTLIVGMTEDETVRADFETKMAREFSKREREARRSSELFDALFTSIEQKEEALNEVEQDLLNEGFDAILLTKVVGFEDYQRLMNRMANIEEQYTGFSDDYLSHQRIYYEADYYDQYTLYHLETSLYCIWPDKDRELVWRVLIEVTDTEKMGKAVEDFVELLALAMEEQELIFEKPLERNDIFFLLQ